MLGAPSRRLRLTSTGFAAAAFILASVGAAPAQMQLLQDGLKRATESLGRSDTVTLENVTLQVGPATYRLPRIEFTGSNLSQAELAALFDKNAAEPIAARLARLSAARITAPELVVEQEVGGKSQVTRYRNIVVGGVTNGRIPSASADGGTFEMKGGGSAPATSGTMGRLALTDIDVPQAARIYAERAGAAKPALSRIYGGFSLDDLALTADKGVRIKVAKLFGKDFSARPTKDSWAETMKALEQPEGLDKASPAAQARVLAAIADLFDAMQVGSVEATGIEIVDPTTGKEGGGRIARIAYTGGGQQPADMRVEGLEITAKDTKARIGLIAFTGFSFASTMAELRDLGDKPLKDLDITVMRRLIPTIGTIRFSGVDFDVPNEKSTAPKPENIKFTIKDVEVTADKPLNGIPTNVRVGVDSLAMPIDKNAQEDGLKELAAMGYGKLNVSYVSAMAWNEAGNELVVREISFRGADMGSATIKGVIGGVTKDVFNPDTALAMVALVGATAKSVEIAIENKGLFERAIAQEAAKQKKSPDDLRKEFGVAAAIAVPAMLGNSGQAKALGQAVARFIAKPGKLTISARTKDPAGLGLTDIAMIGEPAAVLDKLEVTATAE